VLADAGYWKNDAIEAIVAHGITLVAPDADKRKQPRPAAAAASTTSPAEYSQRTGAKALPQTPGHRRASLRPD
jgi:hypothetical protein